MKPSKSEIIRRLRLGDLQKLSRFRYGPELPDDDAGREDLFELLLPISQAPEHQRKMANAIEVWAPWMGTSEAAELTDRINRMPRYERLVNARRLGERLRVTNRERERLKLQTIKPVDKTDKELRDLRKAKNRDRERRRRRAAGCKPREIYFARSLQQQKPWKTEGISRATWYRKQALKQEQQNGKERKPAGGQVGHRA